MKIKEMIDQEKIDVDAGFPKARSALVNNFISQIDCEHSRSVSVTGHCHFSLFNNNNTYLFNTDHH